MTKGRITKDANRKVANRKGFRMRKARARFNRSKIEASVTISEKEKRQLREYLIPGNKIGCSGNRNYYPQAVYFFMRKHCLKCELSFPNIAEQVFHMEEIHDGEIVCQRCFQPFPEGTDIIGGHGTFVNESFQEKLP